MPSNPGRSVLAGAVADVHGVEVAIGLVAAVTFGSGLLAAIRMTETLRMRVGAPLSPASAIPDRLQPVHPP